MSEQATINQSTKQTTINQTNKQQSINQTIKQLNNRKRLITRVSNKEKMRVKWENGTYDCLLDSAVSFYFGIIVHHAEIRNGIAGIYDTHRLQRYQKRIQRNGRCVPIVVFKEHMHTFDSALSPYPSSLCVGTTVVSLYKAHIYNTYDFSNGLVVRAGIQDGFHDSACESLVWRHVEDKKNSGPSFGRRIIPTPTCSKHEHIDCMSCANSSESFPDVTMLWIKTRRKFDQTGHRKSRTCV